MQTESRVLAPRHVLLVDGGSLTGALPLPPNPSSHHGAPEGQGPSRGSGSAFSLGNQFVNEWAPLLTDVEE